MWMTFDTLGLGFIGHYYWLFGLGVDGVSGYGAALVQNQS